jgi:uncharacterized iron-regulated membrane protein
VRTVGQRVYALHQWLGLVAGALLSLVSATGTVLVFAEELDRALNPRLLRAAAMPAATPGAARSPVAAAPGARVAHVSYDTVLARVRRAFPTARIHGIRDVPRHPGDVFTVNMDLAGRYWFVHVDPATGRLLGDRDADASLVRRLLVLHYALLVRPWGEVVIFTLGLALVGSTLSGLWVYRRSLLRPFRVGVRWRRTHGRMGGAPVEGGPAWRVAGRDWRLAASDAHHLLGVLGLVFNLGIAGTGAVMLWPTVADVARGEAHAPARTGAPADPAQPPFTAFSLDTLAARARARLPGFVETSLFVPAAPGEPVAALRHRGRNAGAARDRLQLGALRGLGVGARLRVRRAHRAVGRAPRRDGGAAPLRQLRRAAGEARVRRAGADPRAPVGERVRALASPTATGAATAARAARAAAGRRGSGLSGATL